MTPTHDIGFRHCRHACTVSATVGHTTALIRHKQPAREETDLIDRFRRPIALVGVLALVVTGCTSVQTASPSPTPGATATASASPEATELTATPASPSLEPTAPVPTEPPAHETEPPPPCGEADPTCLSADVVMIRDIPVSDFFSCGSEITCRLFVDSFALPTVTDQPGGAGRPVVVMIPGGPLPPGNRDYLWNLARSVAGRGAVVFTADYRSSPAYGGGYPTTFADVACAIRVARQRARSLGGDPSRVTLVAHSYGGFLGAVLALSTTDYAAKGMGCLTTSGDGRPDAFAGIAGVYTLDRVGPGFLVDFFGGDRATAPAAWGAGDVAVLARRTNRRRVPVRLIAGTNDPVAPPATADEFAAILKTAGYDVEATVEDGATHDTVLNRVLTVDAIVSAYTGVAR